MTLKVGESIPGFSLPSLNGNRVWESLEKQEKMLLLLVFAKKDCSTCLFSLPFIDRLSQYPEKRVSVALVIQENHDEAEELREELGLELPILIDDEPHSVSESFGIRFVPTGFLIDPQGVIQNRFVSFEREELKTINRKLAGAAGVPPIRLFLEGENVPAFRPG